jgi:hypothetical protein
MSTPTLSSAYAAGFPGDALRRTLQTRYQELLAAGIPSYQILVLLESRTRAVWTEWLKTLETPTGAHRVHTPGGWMQQELRLWWPVVEEALTAHGLPAARPFPSPLFVPIDLSQHLLGHFAHSLKDEEGGLIRHAQVTPRYQSVQVLDALGRALEHGASFTTATDPLDLPRLDKHDPAAPCLDLASQVVRKLQAGFSETQNVRELAPQVGSAIALYLDGMLRHRLLDHALTVELFSAFLFPDPRYQAHLTSRTTYLLVDALDEASPRLQALYGALQKAGAQAFFTLKADPDPEAAAHPFKGGLREYVGADPQGGWTLVSTIPQVPTEPTKEPPLAPLGRALHDGLLGTTRRADIPAGALHVKLDDYAPAEMLSSVMADLGPLLDTVPPSEIALVAPALSPLLIWHLRQKLEPLGVPLYVFAGTNRLCDYRPVRQLLTLAKLVYADWHRSPTRFELLELLEVTTGLNPLKLGRLAKALFPDNRLQPVAQLKELAPNLDQAHYARYDRLASWVDGAASSPLPDLETFFRQAFAQVYAPFRQSIGGTYAADEAWQREVSQLGQLIDLTARFRETDARVHAEGVWGLRFLQFLDESPIAERPFFQREPHWGSVTLATASQLAEQGYVDPKETLRHLFLLDFGSDRWWKPDRKELTNARVLSARYPGGVYTPDQEQLDMNEKLGRVLLAACLKVREKLWIYGCLTDDEGRENQGELPYLLASVVTPTRETAS